MYKVEIKCVLKVHVPEITTNNSLINTHDHVNILNPGSNCLGHRLLEKLLRMGECRHGRNLGL